MRSILGVAFVVAIATLAVTGAARVQQAPQIRVLGYFDASFSDGEHRTGYALQLWRHKQTVVGFLLVPQGLIGDSPTGLLENVSLTPDGHLSFTATVPGGWDIAGEQHVRQVYGYSSTASWDRIGSRAPCRRVILPQGSQCPSVVSALID
jgi:hypothetical protein